MDKQTLGNSENFNLSDFFTSEENSLEGRVTPFSRYLQKSCESGEAHYLRTIASKTSKKALVVDHLGQKKEMWMLGSNNYLDFAAHPEVIAAVQATVQEFGVGMGGPPLLNGMSEQHRNLERRIAKLKGQEDAMLFGSGFQAHLGWTSALLRSQDHVIYDELNHASLYDGIRLARTQFRIKATRFAHNNMHELEQILQSTAKKPTGGLIFVVVEGVYSMDGDLAPLPEIAKLCEQYHAYLVVDDAHGTGVMGKHGEGTPEHFQVEDKVAIAMGTFSKSFAVTGGFIAASKAAIDYLRFYSRSYMFSAHLPLATVAAVNAGLDLLEKNPTLIQQLHANAQYFAGALTALGFQATTQSAIIPIHIPSSVDIRAVNRRFHELGVFLNSIEFPAVSLSEQRLRVSVLASLSKADLDQIIAIFAIVGKEFGLIARG